LIVALPKGPALCRYEQIELEQLNNQPFIMHSPTHGKYFYDRIMSMTTAAGVSLNVAQYIDQTPTILSLVRAGLGLGILPASSQRFHYDNVEFRLIANNSIQAEMSMVWRTDEDNPAVTAFRLMAAEYFANKAPA
jgi:DNA-binding transcriptional LysR family regulator